MTPLPDSLLESVAAAAVREGLADAIFTRLSTPLGRLLVVQGPDGLVRIAFEEEPEDHALAEVAAALGPRIIGSDRELATERDALSALPRGRHDVLDLPVDLRLTARAVPARRARGAARERARAARPSPTASWPPAPATRRPPRGRHGLRAQPDPDRRALPPRAARARAARQLRRRAGAQARAARRSRAPAYCSLTVIDLITTVSGGLARVRVGLDAADLRRRRPSPW